MSCKSVFLLLCTTYTTILSIGWSQHQLQHYCQRVDPIVKINIRARFLDIDVERVERAIKSGSNEGPMQRALQERDSTASHFRPTTEMEVMLCIGNRVLQLINFSSLLSANWHANFAVSLTPNKSPLLAKTFKQMTAKTSILIITGKLKLNQNSLKIKHPNESILQIIANPIDGFATEITPRRRVRQNGSNWKLIHGFTVKPHCDWKFNLLRDL